MTNINLGNVGELSKPATVLIEKVANAVGVLYEPRRIKERAKAEAEAQEILALSDTKVDEIKRRAVQRFVYEELRKQNNMESIMEKAIPALNEEAKPGDVEDDWIANFFDKCRLISDEQMQALWAKILAGEANGPGGFSKKTVNIVASLDKSDAEAFTTLCGFAIKILQGLPFPLIYDIRHSIYKENGISFFGLSNLESIGLIRYDNAGFAKTTVLLMPSDTTGRTTEEAMHQVPTRYYGQSIVLELPQDADPALRIGTVMLTEPGEQLASVCDAHAVAGFVDYLKGKWKEFGYKIEP